MGNQDYDWRPLYVLFSLGSRHTVRVVINFIREFIGDSGKHRSYLSGSMKVETSILSITHQRTQETFLVGVLIRTPHVTPGTSVYKGEFPPRWWWQ